MYDRYHNEAYAKGLGMRPLTKLPRFGDLCVNNNIIVAYVCGIKVHLLERHLNHILSYNYRIGQKNVAVSAAVHTVCMPRLAEQSRNGLQVKTSTIRSVPLIPAVVYWTRQQALYYWKHYLTHRGAT